MISFVFSNLLASFVTFCFVKFVPCTLCGTGALARALLPKTNEADPTVGPYHHSFVIVSSKFSSTRESAVQPAN